MAREKYLLLCFENEQYWIKLDEQLIAEREIIIDSDQSMHISCREDCLAEGRIIVEELEGECREVSKQDFEALWAKAINSYQMEWAITKKRYPIGSCVDGVCKYFYPQGAIIKGSDFVGVCEESEGLNINSVISASVKKYDEINLWLVLE